MKILIIGGTGFISSRLTTLLIENGHQVTLLNRGLSNASYEDKYAVEHLTADRSNTAEMKANIEDRTFDVVYDFVAYTASDSSSAVDIFTGRTGQFIHCSTISVYMVSHQVDCPITEDQDQGPLMEFWPQNPFGMQYGIDKRACEKVLWQAHRESGFPITMLRPTFASGPGDPVKRDYFWIERLNDGGPLLIPGHGIHKFQQVYVEDVAQVFFLAAGNSQAIGQAYNVSQAEENTLWEYLNILGKLMGKTPEIASIAQENFDQLPLSYSHEGDVFPFNTRTDAIFSIEKIQADLNFRPTPLREWLGKTIAWYAAADRGHSNGYSRRTDEIELAQQITSSSQAADPC
ncbi:MAG: NAD-dependent epimerase/dehydratase family protein [Candidatus Marinimicrobia bacterium]|nr:NAD-dependent epimerase/dehydratase family protein [Candidatus Neomarinimicrobiota bacterium]